MDIRAEWRELDRQIEALNSEFAALAQLDETARRLATIPGVGVLARAHRKLVVVALANKLARIAWATLRGRSKRFDPSYAARPA